MYTILVVDDHMEIRLIFSRALRDAGFIVSTADNGQEAIAAIEKSRPDLILLDVFMPIMNGPQFLEHLRLHPIVPPVPILLLSAVADSPEVQYARTLGVTGFVRKGDFTLAHLVQIVNESLPKQIDPQSTAQSGQQLG